MSTTTSHDIPSVLEGKRLKYSLPTPDSDEDVAKLLSDHENAMKHLAAMSKKDIGGWKVEDTAKRREFITANQAEGKGWFANVYTKDTNEFVGIAGLREIDWNNRAGEFGIIIAANQWNKGYSLETHYMLLAHSFEVLKLERIFFVTASANVPMISFCVKTLQAVHEGTSRNRFARSWTDPSAGYDNTETYSILSAEWPEMKVRLEEKLKSFV